MDLIFCTGPTCLIIYLLRKALVPCIGGLELVCLMRGSELPYARLLLRNFPFQSPIRHHRLELFPSTISTPVARQAPRGKWKHPALSIDHPTPSFPLILRISFYYHVLWIQPVSLIWTFLCVMYFWTVYYEMNLVLWLHYDPDICMTLFVWFPMFIMFNFKMPTLHIMAILIRT
jgi:hypothetical protein